MQFALCKAFSSSYRSDPEASVLERLLNRGKTDLPKCEGEEKERKPILKQVCANPVVSD